MTYQLIYSPESLDDLRDIYSYITFEKLAPENAEGQVNRIRKAIRSLDLFPEGHTTVDWEPWASMEMRFLPVDNLADMGYNKPIRRDAAGIYGTMKGETA